MAKKGWLAVLAFVLTITIVAAVPLDTQAQMRGGMGGGGGGGARMGANTPGSMMGPGNTGSSNRMGPGAMTPGQMGPRNMGYTGAMGPGNMGPGSKGYTPPAAK